MSLRSHSELRGSQFVPMGRRYVWALLAVAAFLAAFQLFAPPVLGVADNGDYGKLSHHACIGPVGAVSFPYFDYYEPRFAVRPEYCGSIIPTSTVVPLYAASAVSRLILGPGRFDLRILGALYLGLYLGAVGLLMFRISGSSPMARVTLLAVLGVFFSAVYIPLLNTFYMDAFALVLLAWAIALGAEVLCSPTVRWFQMAAFTTAVLLLATTKMQYALVALAFVPLLWFRRRRPVFPGVWFRGAATATLLGGLAWYASLASPWYTAITVYDGLFFKFIPATEDPVAALRSLGLGPEFDRYVGAHAFSSGTRMQREDYAVGFGRLVTPSKLTWFIVTHPKAAWQAMLHDLDEASLERVRMKIGDAEYRLGNYERSAGHPPSRQSRFLCWWSEAKSAALARRPLAYLAYVLLLVAGTWFAADRQPACDRAAARVGALCLTTMLPAIAGPAFLDAVDTGRHLLMFNAVLDIFACALVWLSLRAWAVRKAQSVG
jgi:hypothetical protein